MKNLLTSKAIVIFLLFFPNLIFSQTPPPLGIAADFVLFTSTGALSIVGASQITGNVGTDIGAFTSTVNINGQKHISNAVSVQCALDVITAYNNLDAQVPGVTLGAVLGSGQTLLPNVYLIPGAGTSVGTLILDGGGDSNACFVFKIDGAFAAAAGSSVILTNGAKACNVFWRVDGATAIATNSVWKGSIICFGAVAFAIGFNIDGRILATSGAISVSGITAKAPTTCSDFINGGPTPPNLSTAGCFASLTSNGTVTNTGTTNVIGSIGTNSVTVSGFNPLGVVGIIHSTPDAVTAQASSDLNTLHTYLYSLPNDIELLFPTLFGFSQVLTPNVYLINAATVLNDTIFLNAQGDSTAIFVIRIMGALTTADFSQVVLVGGAQADNVFWQVEGAATISHNSNFKGIIVANNGAISLDDGVVLNGRAFSINGNITTVNATIISNRCTILLPIDLLSFTTTVLNSEIQLNWVTTAETNNDYFNVERSADGINFTSIDEINGAGNSTHPLSYSTVDGAPLEGWSYYRLKQTNYNGKINYSDIVSAEFKTGNDFIFNIYPNPFSTQTTFRTSEKLKNAILTIYDSYGHIVKQRQNISGQTIIFHRDNLPSGVYFSRLVEDNVAIVARKLIITD
ncbi:MAG: hypothetical protein ACI976_002059 [Aureispira sp.]|jgi:hypothetical protein